MNKKWYQNWRSWLTIILLIFVPTFLLGLIVMWCCTPWSKKVKWWITGIGLGIPLAGILASLLLVFISPTKQLLHAKDHLRRTTVQEIASSAHRYCVDKTRCPSSLIELKQNGYIEEIPLDPDSGKEYSYELLDSGKECVIETTLSTDETFTRYCFRQATL